jgi:23S rRNA (pseudouridine1915-N3)-methyltransferase
MKQVILSVGKRHDPDLASAIEDFTTRLGREVPTSWHLIRPSGADEMSARRMESDAVLEFVRDSDLVVVLDERGSEMNSVTLAGAYDDWLTRHERVVFVIGGAYGIDAHLLHRADVIWSLSKLVFPHQLVRLILAEQLYRARMITKGHPYHHS